MPPLLRGWYMNKQFFGVLTTVLFLSLNSQAEYLNMIDYVDELVDAANMIQMQSDVAYKIGGTPVADKCVAFMDRSTVLGEMGKAVFTALKDNKASLPNVMKGGTISRYCSKYPQMKEDQKMMIWVMVMTMVAHFESSCNISAKAKGPNGTAKGYFQLHLGREQNYEDQGLCAKNASTSGKLSAKCALSMIERQMAKENGQLFSEKSYWDVLRPGGRAKRADDIQRTLKNSTLCNPVII